MTRDTRVIYPDVHNIYESYVRHHFPEKCKVDTLREVFDAFVKGWQPNTLSVYFKYDEKLWKGTIIHEDSSYDGRVVSFTNFRLPNDGYFYTSDYNDDGQLDAKCDDSRALVSRVAQALVDRNIMVEEENDFVEVKYFEAQQRLAIRFWKADEKSCVTVNFENSFHEGAYSQERKKFVYKLASLKK